MSYQNPLTIVIPFVSLLCLWSGQAFAAGSASAAEDVDPIKVGESLPPIVLVSSKGEPVNLNEAVKESPTLLIFYRGGWCPYCNTHLGKLKALEQPLKALGLQIIAISPDLPKYLAESEAKHKMDYRLLSDADMKASMALGLAFKVDEATREKYQNYGIDLVKASGHDHYLLPVPAAIMVDTKGRVRYRYYNPDYKVRVDNDKLLNAAKALVNSAP